MTRWSVNETNLSSVDQVMESIFLAIQIIIEPHHVIYRFSAGDGFYFQKARITIYSAATQHVSRTVSIVSFYTRKTYVSLQPKNCFSMFRFASEKTWDRIRWQRFNLKIYGMHLTINLRRWCFRSKRQRIKTLSRAYSNKLCSRNSAADCCFVKFDIIFW